VSRLARLALVIVRLAACDIVDAKVLASGWP